MVTLALNAPLDTPFYSGGSVVSGLVPTPYDVALNGRPFMVQLDPTAIEKWGQHFARESLPLVRDQSDQSDEPGEHSVSPEQFWRRSQQTWHKGAGQSWLDWPGADRDRFRSSKGVNPWTQKQLTLHNTTSRVRASANSGLVSAVAGSRVYVGDGNSLLYTTNLSAYTAVTGTPAAACQSVTTDGFNVYAAFGANNIWTTNTGSGAATQLTNTGNPVLVGYVKGRLMVADNAGSIYNVTSAALAALPAALMTHRAGAGFTWVGFAEAPGFIYAAGYAGGTSEIYSVTIKDTGSALTAPTVALTLPAGEIVRCIYGYLGFVIIGTDKGIRVAAVNSDGSLTVGALISTPSVRCLDGQDRFVWFGWTNYDSTSTGLGRLDLSVFTSTLVPAYASDLMVTAQGTVGSTLLLGAQRVFSVDAYGFVAETVGTPVSSATLDTGFIGYDLADTKQAVFLDMRHEALPTGGSVTASLAVNNGTFTAAGTSNVVGSTAPAALYLNGQSGERFEVRFTFAAGATSPTLTRWTLRADVTPQPSSMFTVPVIIADTLRSGDSDYPADPAGDLTFLYGLHDTQAIFPYQEGVNTYQAKLVNYVFLPTHHACKAGVFCGTFVAQLRHITG